MRGYQLVIVLGNLARDPEIRYTANKKKVAFFSVAVNKEWKDKESGLKSNKADFIPVEAWDSLADITEQLFKKGNQIHVVGELRYDPPKEPNGIWRLRLVAQEIIKLTPKFRDTDIQKEAPYQDETATTADPLE